MSKKIANNLFEDKTNVYVSECRSTNDLLAYLVKKKILSEGSLLVTDYQKKGRGQRKNTWVSEQAKNLLFSFVIKPKILLSEQFKLHIITSISLVKSLKTFNLKKLKIKWPNDIYISGKKVAGILIENQIFMKKISHSIIGIGLNVNQTSFNILNATSLTKELNSEIEIQEVLNLIKYNFNIEYNNLHLDMNFLLNRYKRELFGLNESLDFLINNQKMTGKIKDVNSDGTLNILINKKIKRCDFGSISYL